MVHSISAQTLKLLVVIGVCVMCDLTCTLKDRVVINASKTDDADDDLRARQYSVPSELIEDIDGKKVLCLTRKEVCVRRLLTLQARSHVNTSHAD
jgi:hypothetical protein